MRSPTKRVLLALVSALALVLVLSAFALLPPLHFLGYPLVPGIALSGTIFTDVESDHILRMTVASIAFNTIMYAVLFYVLFLPRARRRSSSTARRV